MFCFYVFFFFIILAYKFYQKSDSGSSRKLFRFSLIHLPILMILFFINKKELANENDKSKKMALQSQTTKDPTIVASTVKAIL